MSTHRHALLTRAPMLVLAALLSGCATSSRPDHTEPAALARDAGPLAPVAWLAEPALGWEGGAGDTWYSERWSAPRDGLMLGTFRMSKAGKPVFMELLTIAAGPTDPAAPLELRLRHFNPDQRAWEPQPAPEPYRLIAASEREIIFERAPAADQTRPGRQIYRRTATGMEIHIESEHNGRPQNLVFTFTPAAAPTR